ncbi:MAG: hypothetical protein RHS_2980 [Robinsoniella sp. RHS]|nr:MAG: hypothetical protein RHS_2980 [Robinsoniella sp. RHS]
MKEWAAGRFYPAVHSFSAAERQMAGIPGYAQFKFTFKQYCRNPGFVLRDP